MLGSDTRVTHIIKLPSRDWAECAAEDLRCAGYRAIVQPDPDGTWMLVARGTEEQILRFKYGMAAAADLDGGSHLQGLSSAFIPAAGEV